MLLLVSDETLEKVEKMEKDFRERNMQEQVMSEEMRLFFTKLLELKEFVSRDKKRWSNWDQSCQVPLAIHTHMMDEIYLKLDSILKEKQ